MRSGKISVLAISAALMAGEPDVGFGSVRASGAAPDSSVLVLAEPSEPGTRLVVAGRVARPDGRPAGHERIGVYHTDAKGEYGVHPTRRTFPPARDARLSGLVVTDAQGRFEIRTIRPGHYPGGGTPQHIHFIVGRANQELLFADDPLLENHAHTGEAEGTRVRPVTTDAKGVQHVSIELKTR